MRPVPTILVAGVVPRLDRLKRLASVKRALGTEALRESLRPGIDLVVVGALPSSIDRSELIAGLRCGLEAAVPVVHVPTQGTACRTCGADLCLPVAAGPEALVGLVRLLLNRDRGRSRRTRARAPHPLETASRQNAASLLLGLVDAVPGIVYVYDLVDQRVAYVSPSVTKALGHTPAEITSLSSPSDLIHPDDLGRTGEAGGFAGAGPIDGPFEAEFRVKAKDGRWRILHSRGIVLARADGRREQVLGVAADVTDERETRRMLEHSQRLEELGRLAGGVIHDFNNILGVITGHAQLTRRMLPREHPACAGLEQVVKASEQAAALTQRLLAFSRQSSRPPERLDVNAIATEIGALLRRVIAEDVELEIRPAARQSAVRAERTEIEQVLLNLAVNARDAMPDGGRLTIETRNAELGADEAASLGAAPGRYVVLEVADTGTGMDAETRQRIFEPFFTTKPEGTGSGLGLATVLGVVKRFHGAIAVDSAPGSGTRFRVYLPRIDSPAALGGVAPGAGEVCGRGETILLVEDADPVRDVTRELLEGLGYMVLPASDGYQALTLARGHPGPIHVLLTDMVMPRLGGASLAAEVSCLRPQVRVLYMSGYSGEAFLGKRGLDDRTLLLHKPFTRGRLAQAVRTVLDASDS